MALNEISLKWNGFQINMLNNLKALFYDQGYADVTLVSEGTSLKAHKVVLSACSPLFSSIFTQNAFQHPIIILQGVSLFALQTLLTFVYNGEVHVTQEFLPELLKAAESLKIKGLSVVGEDSQVETEQNTQSPSKRKLPCDVENDAQNSKKSFKQECVNDYINDNDFCDFGQVTPKTELPELIWAEAIIDEEPEIVDSSCDVDCESSTNSKICDTSSFFSQSIVKTNCANFTKKSNQAKKSNISKKKNKLKSHNTIVCLNADIDKDKEMVECGKENMISTIEIENTVDNVLHSALAVETLNGRVNCEPELDTECKEVRNCVGYTSPKFPCPFCTRVYHTWGYRRRHIKSRHRADKPVCKWCSSVCTSQSSWFEHVVRKHNMGCVEARECLVVLVEAHAVLTCPSPPSPSALLADIHVDDIE